MALTSIASVGAAWADDPAPALVPGPVGGCPAPFDLFEISGSGLGKVLRPHDKNQDDFVCLGDHANLVTGHGQIKDNTKPL